MVRSGKRFAPGSIPIGREAETVVRDAVGFVPAPPVCSARLGLLLSSCGGHNTIVAPTGGGKGVGSIVPALLGYDGPTITIDPKGENYAITAAHRRRLGDEVVLLDPFGVTGDAAGSLNPLDLASIGTDAPEDSGRTLSDLLIGGGTYSADPFWDNTSGALLAGLLTTAVADQEPEKRRLSWLRDLFSEDFAYSIAVMLDTNAIRNRDARQEITTFLSNCSERTRPSIQSTAAQHLRLFGSDAVRRATDTTSFDLGKIVDGARISLYIVIPPDKLSSHRSLLRLWLGTLTRVLTTRKVVPRLDTLMLIDEAAQLGRMQEIVSGITLLRGYGLRLWTYWQDLSQVRTLYPNEWPTMLNNCTTVQLFGARNWRMAEEFASVSGEIDAARVLTLDRDQQLVIAEGRTRVVARLNYLRDPAFARRYAPNPFYARPKPAR